jgi:hypothetical protein
VACALIERSESALTVAAMPPHHFVCAVGLQVICNRRLGWAHPLWCAQLAIDLQRRDSRPTAVSAEKVRGLVAIAVLTGVSARVRKESKKINLGYCPPPTVYRSIKGKAANENFFVDRKIVYGDDVRAH